MSGLGLLQLHGSRRNNTLSESSSNFAVQITCESCVRALKKALQDVKGVKEFSINMESKSVLVETTLLAEEVHKLLETTGRKAVLMGMGTVQSSKYPAVEPASGVGYSTESCNWGGIGLSLHKDECFSCFHFLYSCGEHYNPHRNSHGGPGEDDRHVGDLGNIFAADNGRASFRLMDERLKVYDIIGRSLVVDEGEDDLGHGCHPLSKITGNSGRRLASGIIARSAGLFENDKQLCTCDGITIWEERNYPIAGPGRSTQLQSPPANL
uniref:Superoxide dismutase copper chaperone n=1 Tax=Xenopus tropicalis TaxID=8364 RepID=A0A6I8SCW4_XENTR